MGAAILVLLATTVMSLPEIIGPFRYRTGNAWAHTRQETTFSASDRGYVVERCSQPMVGAAAGLRQCWTAPVQSTTTNRTKVDIQVGKEIYTIDLFSKGLILRTGKVKPGKPKWSRTPLHKRP